MRLTGNRCLCSPRTGGCGEYFNHWRAFDLRRTGDHRINDRRCRTVAEMAASGMRRIDGVWYGPEDKRAASGGHYGGRAASIPAPDTVSALSQPVGD